ncbi:glucans biosynthesis glucosyltransferase MdoH [soil metagenome]
MAMPVQSLSQSPSLRPIRAPQLLVRRFVLVAFTIAATAMATAALLGTFAADQVTVIEAVGLILFGSLFAWTAFSCASAFAGFIVMLGEEPRNRLRLQAPLPLLSSRTAILVPVYNEDPVPVLGRLEAMLESVRSVGAASHFDVFILSDTQDLKIAATERAAYDRLRGRFEGRAKLYYRRRTENTDRKAGNIADWVRRFGSAYAFMVVLDADSLMTGETLVRLTGAMEESPDVGLIQTVPTIVNGRTLFARVEQFASRLYGPLFARGLEWWSGAESSYWGHNAILRVRAFADQAGLPSLPGPRPFGGSIMSHDFVEAALMRRAGWEVRLAPELGGSYEEGPPTLIDQIVRDRRWCQGNLQHMGVMAAKGLHPLSRFHLLRGFSSYLTAPLWLGLLATGLLLASFPTLGGAPDAARSAALDPVLWAILGLSMTFLILPKLLAWIIVVRRGGGRGFGSPLRALASIGLETVISTLIAPVVLFAQTRAVLQILAGKDSGWTAQRRNADRLSLLDALRIHKAETAFGLGLMVTSLAFDPTAFVWAAVPALSLTFAFALSAWTARDAGELTLLTTPELQAPPRLLVRAIELGSQTWTPARQKTAPHRFPAEILSRAFSIQALLPTR